jgi:hypothetical protein
MAPVVYRSSVQIAETQLGASSGESCMDRWIRSPSSSRPSAASTLRRRRDDSGVAFAISFRFGRVDIILESSFGLATGKESEPRFLGVFHHCFFLRCGLCGLCFLFSLYLSDSGFKERAIGLVGGVLTLGSLLGTLPARVLAQKFGLRRTLVFC